MIVAQRQRFRPRQKYEVPSHQRRSIHGGRLDRDSDCDPQSGGTEGPSLAFYKIDAEVGVPSALRPAVRKRLTRSPLPTASRLTGYDQRTFGKRDRDGFD
jgi:hypothetical protein